MLNQSLTSSSPSPIQFKRGIANTKPLAAPKKKPVLKFMYEHTRVPPAANRSPANPNNIPTAKYKVMKIKDLRK